MNSRFKFRAWNKLDKVMITDLNSPRIISGVLHCDSDDILMQFTGLKDSKGVDIYEGDILKFKDHEGLRITSTKEEIKNWPNIGVVFWDSGWSGNPDAKFNCSDISGGNQPTWWMCNTKQVIGNIFETPNLLTS